MWSFLVVILIISEIGSVDSTVLLEETTTDISYTFNKVSWGGGGTLVVG